MHNELKQASTPRGSALNTLYATFHPVAHARGVVDEVVGRVLQGVLQEGAESGKVTGKVSGKGLCEGEPECTAKERVYAYFKRRYSDVPRVRMEMTKEGVYRCTVMHLDGQVLGIGEGEHREGAEEGGFRGAVGVVVDWG